jgi:hypothetical protein
MCRNWIAQIAVHHLSFKSNVEHSIERQFALWHYLRESDLGPGTSKIVCKHRRELYKVYIMENYQKPGSVRYGRHYSKLGVICPISSSCGQSGSFSLLAILNSYCTFFDSLSRKSTTRLDMAFTPITRQLSSTSKVLECPGDSIPFSLLKIPRAK